MSDFQMDLYLNCSVCNPSLNVREIPFYIYFGFIQLDTRNFTVNKNIIKCICYVKISSRVTQKEHRTDRRRF